jgi:ATP-dependent Clp protease adaptor protein ClpS
MLVASARWVEYHYPTVAQKRQEDADSGVVTEQKTEKKLAKPRLYKVILLNDDFTTMEFVVALLIHVFHHGETTAQAIMLNIHRTGAGIAGVYTKEIAETKVSQVMELAEKAEYPLQCTMEPDDEDE